MKNTLFIFISAVALASCTKTKNNYINVPVHDTAIVTYTPTLVGVWKSSTGVSPITFTASTFQIQTYPTILFSTVADTIFDKAPADLIWQRWIYKISNHNDTLWLTSINPTIGTTDVYTH